MLAAAGRQPYRPHERNEDIVLHSLPYEAMRDKLGGQGGSSQEDILEVDRKRFNNSFLFS